MNLEYIMYKVATVLVAGLLIGFSISGVMHLIRATVSYWGG
jgi:hypothetical protein